MTRATPPPPFLTTTVVIPVKDDADELRRCLRALALQTRAPDEVIVVDNGSSDASATVAREAGAVVVRCDTPGIPAAASAGYDAATSDLILRLDADCLPADSWVEAMERGFRRRPDVAAFTGGARFVDGPRPLRSSLAVAYLGAYAVAGVLALGHLPLFGSNLAMRRTAWSRVSATVHRHDTEVHDDLDLAFHLGERFRIRSLPGAAMGISMRPFSEGVAFARRLNRGIRTVVLHWPRDFPPVRWERMLLRRMRHATRTREAYER
ncbi:glycosyltransferase family 2 protein [Microbacterium sp. cx-55]|uniref:glycosyltransferase family A protein n=1 Tax=Microbacterium sp. cx-55 TaxID=2875948 RepID=UPI001CBBAE1B|nr:glycosyltransferase family 2 protein [Microbacterium sp. cx-55]MBZ4486566.1 glycosyltransferase family 2 protein [Microbacterium sp. cx-55]UGB36466.1 glycosyltransferase family 2 protein [Microbacterium sp. cx-55]